MIELPETFDTYLIPGTNVLRNLIGATTVTELEAAENDLVSARMLEFQSNLPVAQGTLRQLQQIHRQLFQDIYDWAGQIRTVDIVRGSSQVFQPLAFFDVGVQYAERILDRDIKTARTQEAQNQTATVMNAMPLSGSLGAIRSALGDVTQSLDVTMALYGSKACADFVNEAKNIHARQIAEQFASEQGVRDQPE